MNRYRTYAQTDDPPLIEGDRSLIGSNDWDAAENIPAGQVQAAVNMDFTTQDAVTRGGFVCLPGLGSAVYPTTRRLEVCDLRQWNLRSSDQFGGEGGNDLS